ncbi:MAG: hypothetical protein H6782_01390 [Candidatus Nomurabacteria bacterium]|nr:MAG: hypothetical protein H6782_01390 [Candidatus Nomurabacteria bacterium]
MNTEKTKSDVREEGFKSETWYYPLTVVTPVSKYLALALFVTLPFFGVLVGNRVSKKL